MNKVKLITALLAVASAGVVVSSVQAAAPAEPQGRITVREYWVSGPNSIARLTDYAGYPDSPDATFFPIHFEWPTGPTGNDEDSTEQPPGNIRDQYATEIRGYYHAGRTGEHFFAVASDDPGELWLSTDESFDNLELIANEPTWNPVRAFGSEARRNYVDEGTNDERLQNWSKGINLTQGKAYAIMARAVEGGGGDNLAVAHSNELFFEDGGEPIPGEFLSTFNVDSFAGTRLNAASGSGDGFTAVLKDGEGTGAVSVDADSITAALDGNAVEVSVSKDGANTTITHSISEAPFLASGATYTVTINWKDSGGADQTADAPITIAPYSTITPAVKLEGVDTGTKGFLMFVKQADFGIANNTAPRLAHLADDSENQADDLGSDDFTWTVELINFDQDGNPQGEFRDLGDGSSQDVLDDFIPGIPGLTDTTDQITAWIQNVIRIPAAGLYTFGFNSDDGFRTTIGNDAADSVIVGEFNGGRGASTTAYTVLFEEAGDYAVQNLWYEGGGGANLEFFTNSPNKALIGDTGNDGLESFAVVPVLPTRVTAMSPGNGAGGVAPTAVVSATIEDGSASVDEGSVSLTVDGATADHVTVSKSGGVTTVTVDRGGAAWASEQVVNAELSYTAGGNTRTIPMSFTVMKFAGIAEDSVAGYPGLVVGNGAWTDDAGGITGEAGDYGLDVSANGGGSMWVADASWLNATWEKDTATTLFWMKKIGPLANSSSIWIRSQSAGSGNRSWQAHTPWSNGQAYFDTQGCCAGGTQRVNGPVADFEDYDDDFWSGWHLWSFHKDLDIKEIRIDGTLFLDSVDADILSADVTDLWLGSAPNGGNPDRSIFDDFAIYDKSLSAADVEAIAGGKSAGTVDNLVAFWDFNTPPMGGGDITGWTAQDGTIVIEFTGTLVRSDSLTGDYTPVAGATSPYTVPADGESGFFKVQQ